METAALAPLSILRIINKQIAIIAVAALLLSLCGAAIVYLLPDVFRAESLILVEQQKIPEKLVESTIQVELQDRLATISQQILSGTQLQKIIDKYSLYADSKNRLTPEELIETMRNDIEIKTEKGWSRNRPGAFRIFYKSRDSQKAATVANEITALFVEENLKSREVQATGASEFLGSQLEDARKRLLEQESKLADFKRKNSGQLPGQENGLFMALTQLQSQSMSNNEAIGRARGAKTMLESDLRSAEDALQRLIASSTAVDPPPSPSPNVTSSAAASGQQPAAVDPSKLRSLQLEQVLDQAKRRYTSEHPQVRALEGELLRVRQQEAREREAAAAARRPVPQPAKPTATDATTQQSASAASAPKVSPQAVVFIEQQRDRVEKLKAQISMAQQEIQSKEQEQRRIDSELARNQSALTKLPLNEQEMISVTRDYEVSRKTYETILQRSYTANTAEDLERRQKSERFAVLDSARPPEKPFSPDRPILYALATLLSIALGVMIGIALEYRQNVILGEWELPKDVWLLGRIPVIEDSKTLAKPNA